MGMAQAGTGLQCSKCDEPVRLEGDAVLPELRKAVHAATGSETGDDGHLAAPIDPTPLAPS
jgi:hypothetical protein